MKPNSGICDRGRKKCPKTAKSVTGVAKKSKITAQTRKHPGALGPQCDRDRKKGAKTTKSVRGVAKNSKITAQTRDRQRLWEVRFRVFTLDSSIIFCIEIPPSSGRVLDTQFETQVQWQC